MIAQATPRNTSAAAGVVDPTTAASRVATNASTQGDGDPHLRLSASYPLARDDSKHRRCTKVTLGTGQAHSLMYEASRMPTYTQGMRAKDQLLVHDDHAAPEVNAAMVGIALEAMLVHGTATTTPICMAVDLYHEVQRQRTRVQTLEQLVSTLRAELARAESRSDN